jgi:hypothetical protein
VVVPVTFVVRVPVPVMDVVDVIAVLDGEVAAAFAVRMPRLVMAPIRTSGWPRSAGGASA